MVQGYQKIQLLADPKLKSQTRAKKSKNSESQGPTTLKTDSYLAMSNVTSFFLFTIRLCSPSSKWVGTPGNPINSLITWVTSLATSQDCPTKLQANANLSIKEWRTSTSSLNLRGARWICLRLQWVTLRTKFWKRKIRKWSGITFQRWGREVSTWPFWRAAREKKRSQRSYRARSLVIRSFPTRRRKKLASSHPVWKLNLYSTSF